MVLLPLNLPFEGIANQTAIVILSCTEIVDFQMPGRMQQYVLGLEIPMDNLDRLQVLNDFDNLCCIKLSCLLREMLTVFL